jgi:hypothetical protein
MTDFFIDNLKNNFMYYNQHLSSKKPTLTSKINVFVPETETLKKYLVFPKQENLPEEIHIGNIMINSVDDLQPIILYSVDVSGEQKEKYSAFLKKENLNFDDDDNERVVSIHDAYLPPHKLNSKYKIFEYQNVLDGDFFKLDNLKQYSAIGYEFCKLCKENAFHNEKTIAYHTKIYNFGIKQYCNILKINGFIEYGTTFQKHSLCKVCRNTYQQHNADLQTKLDNKICNQFKPIVFGVLTGNLTQIERDVLTNIIYNSPGNLYGDLLSVLFVSDVAYSGVNFLNTQNIMLLSRITNISKWKQIYSRIIRTGSHIMLKDKEKYAKIYTFVINIPNEKQQFTKFDGKTYEKQYKKISLVIWECRVFKQKEY